MENKHCRNSQLVCCNSCADWDGLRWFDQAGYLICMQGITGACRSGQGTRKEKTTTTTDKCGHWRPTAELASGRLPGCRSL